ncbi:HAD family phosphatase [Candidatus Woesearchaeota archaeon]|nr:HAD family phosphatase [Candidatus Woesearchaeota archaeon]
MIKAVIFDMDGVIIDSEPLHFAAYKKVLERHGKTITADVYKKWFGIQPRVTLRHFLGIDDEEKLKELALEKDSYFRESVRRDLKPINGSVELLHKIKSLGYKVALATAATQGNADLILGKLSLGNFFDAVVTAADTKKGKPDPEVFIKAAEKLNAKPDECVIVEDSKHGIQAARNAGMKCIAVATTHKPDELAIADIVVNSIMEIKLSMLKEL